MKGSLQGGKLFVLHFILNLILVELYEIQIFVGLYKKYYCGRHDPLAYMTCYLGVVMYCITQQIVSDLLDSLLECWK